MFLSLHSYDFKHGIFLFSYYQVYEITVESQLTCILSSPRPRVAASRSLASISGYRLVPNSASSLSSCHSLNTVAGRRRERLAGTVVDETWVEMIRDTIVISSENAMILSTKSDRSDNGNGVWQKMFGDENDILLT